jgi:hypothetical protein
VRHAAHQPSVRHWVAGELVGDQHPRHVLPSGEQLTKAPGRGLGVAPGGDQDVQNIPVLAAELGRLEIRRTLLLADYARRSEDLEPKVRAQLDRFLVDDFSAFRGSRDWTRLGLVPKRLTPWTSA